MPLRFRRLPLARSTVHRYQQITITGAGAVTIMAIGVAAEAIGVAAEAIGTAAAGADPDGAGCLRRARVLAGSQAASDRKQDGRRASWRGDRLFIDT
jgi:hypothetical protein